MYTKSKDINIEIIPSTIEIIFLIMFASNDDIPLSELDIIIVLFTVPLNSDALFFVFTSLF